MQHYAERLLIVLNPDGTLKGAAQYTLTVLDNGKAVQGDAEPVAPETLAAILPNQAALMSQLSGLLANVEMLTAANRSMKDAADKVAAERDQAQAALAEMTQRYEVMTAARDALMTPAGEPQAGA